LHTHKMIRYWTTSIFAAFAIASACYVDLDLACFF
jgi:hypothetical protein